MTDCIPVITLDGPAASGKGTIASRVADALGFHYLDSGALYRIATLDALSKGIDLDDAQALTAAAQGLSPVFEGGPPPPGARAGTGAPRPGEGPPAPGRGAGGPGVRAALLARQKTAARLPGLVADGRDMGTVVFPEAPLKVFMTATARVRAERRYCQLLERGETADLEALTADLEERDRRDSQRATAPLKPAEDARLLDTSCMGIEEVVKKVLEWWDETKKLS